MLIIKIVCKHKARTEVKQTQSSLLKAFYATVRSWEENKTLKQMSQSNIQIWTKLPRHRIANQ